MVNYREILRLKSQNFSNRQIAKSTRHSRELIAEVIVLARENGIVWQDDLKLTNPQIRDVLYPHRIGKVDHRKPDTEYIHKEMAKSGVTLTLLWSEYCEQCSAEKAIPYQYTQFCEHYKAYVRKTKATMRIKRKPGELLEVDWAGKTLSVTDTLTGEKIPAYVFVATLPCSLYSYAEAFADMKSNNWITAHVHAYEFFGGITRILIPDNLKTGVISHTRKELVLNRSYQEMAEHYNTAIIPARPYTPKDKPNAEGTVGIISTWIIAALRNRKFFSFKELNIAIQEKLKEFNSRPFQKKNGSRYTAFENEEKPFLMALPTSKYEIAIWSKATIQSDYLITVENIKYSVPYEFIGKIVDIRCSRKSIEVFFHNNRIASHIRYYGYHDPVVLPEHMPENHRQYLAYSSEHFMEWAEGIGQATKLVTKALLSAYKVDKQAFPACRSLMKLVDKYSIERVESACTRALAYTPSPSIKNIRMILKTGQDKVKPESPSPPSRNGNQYSFTRGADYYGRGGSND